MENYLTDREQKVLTKLTKGLTNKEIADTLFISTHTVKAHLESIYEKLGAKNRVQAAIKALELGFIKINKK